MKTAVKLNTVYKPSNQAPNTLISPLDLVTKRTLEVNDTYLSKVKTLSTNAYHLQDLINWHVIQDGNEACWSMRMMTDMLRRPIEARATTRWVEK